MRGEGFPELCFGEESIDEGMHSFGSLSGDGIEVAVVTLMEAERYMDIECLDLAGWERCGIEAIGLEVIEQRKHAMILYGECSM